MTRDMAIDALIDIGLALPLRMDLRATGDGYSVLVPIEQLRELARRLPKGD